MVTRRADDASKPSVSTAAPSERSLEALQNIFLSPPRFVVGITAAKVAYRLMVGTKGGLSAFWADAITGFDEDLEALMRAAAAFEDERKRGRHVSGIRSANVRASKELLDKVVELEGALNGTIKCQSRAKVVAGLARLLFERRGQ